MADLRPNATIFCMYCGETKPQAGSTKFHALPVCRDCTQKIQAKDKK
jgi:hypothetical protein